MIGVKLVQFYSCPVIQNMLGQSEALYPSPNQIARKINSGAATADGVVVSSGSLLNLFHINRVQDFRLISKIDGCCLGDELSSGLTDNIIL